ncbi:MAG: polyphosphate kinase [Herminiimonas sp.]|nr:polyphosphate kinase [Herminiimonas sp.]MDB5852235.1 polyphosphate kinase [Herminiimonas sp.]
MSESATERFRVKNKAPKLTDDEAAAKPLSTGDKGKDENKLNELGEEIATLQDMLYAEHERKLLVVLQGMDTSGKDGTVKGVFGHIDPQGIRTVPFRAPSLEEKEHDFLWRVHAQTPRKGEVAIFNRSHYEDVLVPYVHGDINSKEWNRRLQHIRDFERLLAETGTVVLKFFLHISEEEQRQRLQERLDDPLKHWKFDPQDLAERKLWKDYLKAYAEVIHETDADLAPWYVIPADSKPHRNLAIASVVAEAMRDMKLAYPPGNPDYANLTVR